MCRRYPRKGQSMNDEETDAGGDFFIDFIKVVIALFFFVLFVTVIGVVIWGLIA